MGDVLVFDTTSGQVETLMQSDECFRFESVANQAVNLCDDKIIAFVDIDEEKHSLIEYKRGDPEFKVLATINSA